MIAEIFLGKENYERKSCEDHSHFRYLLSTSKIKEFEQSLVNVVELLSNRSSIFDEIAPYEVLNHL